jgi:hypothetical protein
VVIVVVAVVVVMMMIVMVQALLIAEMEARGYSKILAQFLRDLFAGDMWTLVREGQISHMADCQTRISVLAFMTEYESRQRNKPKNVSFFIISNCKIQTNCFGILSLCSKKLQFKFQCILVNSFIVELELGITFH